MEKPGYSSYPLSRRRIRSACLPLMTIAPVLPEISP